MRKKLLLAASLALTVLGPGFAAAEDTPTVSVPVRVGAHPDYDRVVFDWPRTVTYSLKQDGSRATLSFDAGGNIQFARQIATTLSRAKGFSAQQEGDKVTVTFATAPQATITSFYSGTSIVIDISGKQTAAEATPQTQQPQAQQPPTPQAQPQPTPAPQPAKQATKTPSTQAPAPTAHPVPKVEAAPTTPSKTEPPAPQPAAAPETPPAAEAPAPLAPQTREAKAAPLAAAALWPPPARPVPPDLDIGADPVLVATLDPRVLLRVAIYQRAGYGYVVFERKLTLTPQDMTGDTVPKVILQTMDLPKNTAFRFVMPNNAELQATLDGTAWKIFAARPRNVAPISSALIAQPDFALGARLLLPLPDAPQPAIITDPIVHDDLIIIPLAQSQAFSAGRTLADLDILPAAQGLVIRPLNDKIVARPVADGIEITAEGGLQLSRALDTGSSQQQHQAATNKKAPIGKSMFDLIAWRGKSNESFSETRQRLQQIIVDVPEAERNRARLELARFYFAHGYGLEALSLLDMLAKALPDIKAHNDFIALTGAAKVLANVPQAALADLNSPAIADQDEMSLWQAVALAQQRDWTSAEAKFARARAILSKYPEPFYSRFSVLAIESALAVGKDSEANEWLETLATGPHSEYVEPAISYLRGAVHAKNNRASAAEAEWKRAAASRDRLYKIRSELALIDLSVSTGSLTPAQAADRLESLRFAWRGDDLEMDILHRLGEFYIQARNIKNGLNSMAQAAALYPSSPMAPAIRKEMSDVFHDVFLGDLGKKLSPLDALTLYQQYRELMPVGKEGDAVMANLAERLVSIDLLDQAASIFEDLAKNRLQGEDKTKAALRLSGIRLLDHKPDTALAALDLLPAEGLSATVQNERNLLRARALSELGKSTEAMALLQNDASQSAKLLRADISMRARNWDDAYKALVDLAGAPPEAGKSLSKDQVDWLVNAAVASAMAGNQIGLDKLAIDYGTAMAATPKANLFNLLTRPEKSGQLRDLAAAQKQLSQVDMFQSVLNGYRAAGNGGNNP